MASTRKIVVEITIEEEDEFGPLGHAITEVTVDGQLANQIDYGQWLVFGSEEDFSITLEASNL